MRTCGIVVVLMVACTDRVTMLTTDGDASSTGAAELGNTNDPTMPTSPTTGGLDNPSGFCRPVDQDPAACPADYVCCSDDPATTQGRLPNYFGQTVGDQFGAPIFSAENNALSYSGQCVNPGFPTPLADGCPLPCNPTWTEAQRTTICGAGTACCPFQMLDPAKDCVLDPDTGRWRSVRGSDIPTLSTWGPAHTTNQDPNGVSCLKFATTDGLVDEAVVADCYLQLTVADQRGFCYASCPCYEDLCDMKNPDWTPRCG